jgi:alginate O-acetyltransferase complex protein AlgI
MNFVTWEFTVFLFLTVLLFVLLPSRMRFWLLLAVSYLFYASWSFIFIGIILLSTSVDYVLSRIIFRTSSAQQKRLLLTAGIAANLVVLGYFKYVNFFLNSAHSLFSWLHIQSPLPEFIQTILPLGISFYTFEAISYLVDVYRGKAPAKNWLEYNFYIMYFPHLISGPIIRFEELREQFGKGWALPSLERIGQGMELILLGFIFKLLIADPVSQLVDPVFMKPGAASSLSTLIAVLGFTVQIYFDFMGYTHIARGASLLFNLELPLNFNHPYLACNIRDFWNRWHISLSRWIRDYLYIPMGGSKGAPSRTITNLLCTMLIAGAWHGAGWTYIAWGGYHGVLLAVAHASELAGKRPGIRLFAQAWGKLPAHVSQSLTIASTFILVVIGWVLFRAPNFPTAVQVLQKAANVPHLFQEILDVVQRKHYLPLSQLIVLLLLCFSGPWMIQWVGRLYRPLPFWAKAQLACILAVLCWFLTASEQIPFIYFQF